jgi:ribosomal 50S subunit-recycling heat shock protein
MRLDDYISTIRIVKRRTVAKEMIEGGRIKLNGKAVKPAHPVNTGDIIRVSYPDRYVEIEVTEIPRRSIRKDDCEEYYKRLV